MLRSVALESKVNADEYRGYFMPDGFYRLNREHIAEMNMCVARHIRTASKCFGRR